MTAPVSAKGSRVVLLLAAFVGGLLLFFGAILLVTGRAPSPIGPAFAGVGGPFRLEDQSGKTVTDADMKGHPFLVFFGFTHCPDVCPTTLLKLAQIRKRAALAHLRVLFVTVDPQRDTPPVLGAYVHAFDPAFEGLTGSAQAIDGVAAAFGVAVNRVELPGGDYTMDHSAVIFLVDDAAQIAAIFTPPFDVASVSADLDRAAPYLASARGRAMTGVP
jgi:protein SCO1